MRLGDAAPDASLPDTEGRDHQLRGDGVTAVVFTCNHCPYALAWHDRIADVARDYADRGVRVLAVNPNDAERYPADSYETMKERVERDGGWPLPYLRDESQELARTFGAKTTPHVFVFDVEGRLRYQGAPDADYRDESQRAAWFRDALEAVLAGGEPQPADTEPVGCSIKWRS